ncbi:MAG TPA: SIS domain-containing protein [Mesorhizobium sp.]|jgi:uncharacterized phosphosugar-binding protein
MTDRTPTAAHYLDQIAAHLAGLFSINRDAIARAADSVEKAARADGLVYLFGTGHSHILALEVHYRAGGLAITVPILSTATMLHEGSVASSAFERMSGISETVFARYPVSARDVVVVISNSGVNAAPVEAARLAKARGATVIALTSQTYSRDIAGGRPRIADIADIVLDNGGPSGDAIVAVEGSALRVGPVTTAAGASLLHAVMAEVAARLATSGEDAPVYLSANLPGAAEHNARLIERYRPRNPHL